MREYSFDLYDQNGVRITTAGGIAKVVAANAYSEVALLNEDGSALANPISLSNGSGEFRTADSVTSVDVYGQAPDGRGFVAKGISGTHNVIKIDINSMHGALKIPFDIGEDSDITANTEFDTGFDADTSLLFTPNPGVYVGEADATETIDVGTDGSGSNDPDGFMDGVAVSGTAGTFAKATLVNSGATLGVLMFVQDSANSGDDAPEGFVGDGDNITMTLSAGSDTAAGIITLPYVFMG